MWLQSEVWVLLVVGVGGVCASGVNGCCLERLRVVPEVWCVEVVQTRLISVTG
jgi:hypothetical protein